MGDLLSDVIRKTLTGFGDRLGDFGPNLLAMVVILAVGILAATAIRLVVRFVLPRLGFDRFAQRSGLSLVLQKGGITTPPSSVVAVGLSWAVLGVFVLLAIGALNLQIAMNLVSGAFTYLPQLLIAVAILILGALISAFIRRSVLIAAVNAGFPSARLLAGGVHTALMVLFVAMALEHLGLGRQVILVSFTIVFGGVVLALALSFGLAGRDMARDFLERMSRRRDGGDDLRHL
jgi:Conserved TM helix